MTKTIRSALLLRIRLFLGLIASFLLAIVGWILVGRVPEADVFPKFPVPFDRILDKNALNQEIKEAAKFAIGTYLSRCNDSDEIHTETGQCINRFGLRITLFESVETLYLLGLRKELSKVLELIYEVNCSKFEYLSSQDFWSRVVGSLIGGFLVTGHYKLLDKAQECAQSTKRIRKKIWKDGISLNEYGAGLPELLTLFKLTGKRSYYRTYDEIVSHLSSLEYPWNFLSMNGFQASNLHKVDATSIRFYKNLAIANAIKSDPRLVSLRSKMHFRYERGNIMHQTLLEVDDNASSTLDMCNDIVHRYLEKGKFRASFLMFDASPLRWLLRQYWLAKNNNFHHIVEYVISQSLNTSRRTFGFSGFTKSGECDGIQHVAFLSDWLKVGLFVTPIYENLGKTAIFNEKGHILDSSEFWI